MSVKQPATGDGVARASQGITRRDLAWVLGIAAVYFAVARLSLTFVVQPEGIASFWPATGIVLAATALMPRRTWPLLLGMLYAADAAAARTIAAPWTHALVFGVGNVGGPALVAWFVRRWPRPLPRGVSLRVVIGRLVAAALPVAAISATIGASIAARDGSPFVETWRLWWITDVVGMSLVASAILAWVPRVGGEQWLQLPRVIESAVLLILLALTAQLVFGTRSDSTTFAPFPFAVLPFLLWAALRLGPRTTSIGMLVLSVIAAWNTAQGLGPFAVAGRSVTGQALQTQLYLAVFGLTALVMAAVLREREGAAQALAESEERYRRLFEDSDTVMVLFDPPSGRILDANPAASAFYGWPRERLRQMTVYDINTATAPEIAAAIEGASSRSRRRFEFRHRLASGEVRDVEIYSGPVTIDGELRLLSMIHDVTARRRVEEALRQAQRIESLGVLAGGVAHDFTNLLTVILGRSTAAISELPGGSAAREHIEEALPAIDRAAELAAKMRAYSGRGQFQVELIDVAALLRRDMPIVQAAVADHVRLDVHLPPSLPDIEADASQIRQALTAVVTNAVEAIGDRGGTVAIVASRRTIGHDDASFWRHTGTPLAPGQYVSIEVRDDGCGMSAETLARAFDPFFTTKFVGRGLGLAAVLGIVRGHRGGVAVESAVGTGTRVELVFPLAAGG